MISVCIITRNERDNLKECLSRLKFYDVEIVVVDTGSTDDSKEVAAEYTDSVYDFAWCDDFSAARNYAAGKAQTDWILMLDTDEFVEEWDVKKCERLIQQNENKAGRIYLRNRFLSDGQEQVSKEMVTRFYNRRLFHYEGKVHEQIVALDGADYDTYSIPFTAIHTGYMGGMEERKKKAKRNLDLLEKELEEHPDDPYTLYQIGKSYYFIQDYEQAIYYYEQTFTQDLNPKLEYVREMMSNYGYALLNTNQMQKALDLEGLLDDLGDSSDFRFMMGLVYMNNAMFEQAIESFVFASQLKDCVVEGVNSYLAYYNIGVIYECLGNVQEAMCYYNKCIGYEPAEQGIHRLKSK